MPPYRTIEQGACPSILSMTPSKVIMISFSAEVKTAGGHNVLRSHSRMYITIQPINSLYESRKEEITISVPVR